MDPNGHNAFEHKHASGVMLSIRGKRSIFSGECEMGTKGPCTSQCLVKFGKEKDNCLAVAKMSDFVRPPAEFLGLLLLFYRHNNTDPQF